MQSMKFHETHFEDYAAAVDTCTMHPKVEKSILPRFPASMYELQNMIFFGPSGIGKYSQVLKCIQKYSPSGLKYEKKCVVAFNKQEYTFKLSDVHYEVDMSILGCNSKLLWHDIYQQIVDVISAKTDKCGIIVCKNFHDIHSELLENFYSYMQSNASRHIRVFFFLVTEHVSFIPDNILQCCQTIHMSRPSAAQYKKCLGGGKLTNVQKITNIKALREKKHVDPVVHTQGLIDAIIETLSSKESCKFMVLREHLYNLLIFGMDVSDAIWMVTCHFITSGKIKGSCMQEVLGEMHQFFKYYYNNYRPIYHMEKYMLFLVMKIHNIEQYPETT